jgi:hypothetical protein
MLKYQELLHRDNNVLPQFEDVEFRCFSQNGEDGILLYIFALIGTTNKKCLEIGAGDGIECNTANLIINHGWIGLLFDGNENNVRLGKEFYASSKDTFTWPPKIVHAWVTAKNINELIMSNGFEGDIDLLSVDLDGVDYWVWKKIECVRPRVVVTEFNNLWGPHKSVTVPYSDNFQTEYTEYGCDYAGASLAAFVKLAKTKGYRLVGCQRYGFNAFFILDGIAEDIFPEVSSSQCFSHPFARYAMDVRVKNILDKEWIEI